MVRESQVESGVKFLSHPQVRASPLSQRISFLEKKGLTPEEISEAMTRSGVGGFSSADDPHLTAAPAADDSDPLWRKLLLPGALLAAGLGVVGATRAREGGGALPPAPASPRRLENGDAAAAAAGPAHEPESPSMGRSPGGGVASRRRGGRPPRPGADAAGDADDAADGASATLRLAEEFGKLSGAMQAQSAALGEAVENMKALAAQREKDDKALLTAQVNAQTAELRAELATIKQLLLIHTGASALTAGSGSAATGGAAPTADAGDAAAAGVEVQVGGDGDAAATGSGADQQASSAEADAAAAAAEAAKTAVDEAAAAAAAEEEERARIEQDRAQKLAATRAALRDLHANSSAAQLKSGVPMLKMFISNLIQHPTVPRYRRLSLSNQNYTTLVAPLEGHTALLEAVGFKRASGTQMEWGWHGSGAQHGGSGGSGGGGAEDGKGVDAETVQAVLKEAVAGLERLIKGEDPLEGRDDTPSDAQQAAAAATSASAPPAAPAAPQLPAQHASPPAAAAAAPPPQPPTAAAQPGAHDAPLRQSSAAAQPAAAPAPAAPPTPVSTFAAAAAAANAASAAKPETAANIVRQDAAVATGVDQTDAAAAAAAAAANGVDAADGSGAGAAGGAAAVSGDGAAVDGSAGDAAAPAAAAVSALSSAAAAADGVAAATTESDSGGGAGSAEPANVGRDISDAGGATAQQQQQQQQAQLGDAIAALKHEQGSAAAAGTALVGLGVTPEPAAAVAS